MTRKQSQTILLISGSLFISTFIFLYESMSITGNIALIAITLISGFPIFKKAWQAALMKSFSIELLVTIAVIGALYISEYEESAAVTFLFLFGEYLEIRSLEKTRSSIKSLIDMSPHEATVIRESHSVTIPANEILQGEHIIVQSGEKIAVDGCVISGQAVINEATITGEPTPIEKSINDHVYSGTIVENGYIKVIAERVGEDTAFAKIIELVEEAQDSKAKSQKFLERFSSFYTPAIIILSIITFIISRDLQMTLTFLVIACPGALVISAPVSIVAGIGNGAKRGVLIKGGETIEKLSKIDLIIFDKTGTLTKGKPEVTEIRAFGIEESDLLLLAAEAEVISEHHLGRTIVKEAKKRGLELINEPSDFEIVKGHGIRAIINDQLLFIGNRKWLQKQLIVIPTDIDTYAFEQEQNGNTVIFVASNIAVMGVISITDQIRDGARTSIQQLKQNGIKQVMILTGDNKTTAEKVANQLGIDEVNAECLPEDKVAKIKKLKKMGFHVAMVGDGINDAPALATADIGIAMGTAGSDVVMETSSVVLMTDNLCKLTYAYQLSKTTVRNMKQNMCFAVLVVLLLITGVFTKYIFLASGMFVHEFSVLVVILNAIRLVGYNTDRKKRQPQQLSGIFRI